MKKLFILSISVFMGIFLLVGCQSQSQEKENPNKITVKQVNPDGSKKVVMELGGVKNDGKDSQKDSSKENPSVLKGVKGMAIDADGLQPSALPPLKKGTKLIIQNTDEKDHWIMAKEGQKNCTDFNPGKALKKGDMYEYTFNAVGECVLFDSLNPDNPKLQSKIVVTD